MWAWLLARIAIVSEPLAIQGWQWRKAGKTAHQFADAIVEAFDRDGAS